MASQQGGRYYTGVGFIDKGIGHVMNLLSDQLPVCKMPGCNKQCYVENDGRVHDFCSKTHAREFQQQKMMRDKRLKAVQHGQSTGGHGGWQGPHSYCTAAAYGTGPSGPSYTRSGTPYGMWYIMVCSMEE